MTDFRPIFVNGTMRSGTHLVSDVLCAHSQINIFSDFVHFFRFVYGRYDRLDMPTVERLTLEMRARLYWRYRVDLDVPGILSSLAGRPLSNASFYQALMESLQATIGAGKMMVGDNAALAWRSIEAFTEMFPGGRVVHIIRDPRAVLASYRKASYEEHDFLGAIYNCIDSMDSCVRLRAQLRPDQYFWMRYEDLIAEPELWIERLCQFLGVEVEAAQLDPARWSELLPKWVRRGWSSHQTDAYTSTVGTFAGFEKGQIDKWRNELDDTLRCAIDLVTHDRLRRFGYEAHGAYDAAVIGRALAALNATPWLAGLFRNWLERNEGSDQYPRDPRDPANWAGRDDVRNRFIESADGKGYLDEIGRLDTVGQLG